MKITICSSATFYKQAVGIEEELQKLGFDVLLPHSAVAMKEANDFTERKTWLTNKADYRLKTDLIRRHLSKVEEGDAVLVINLEKHGISGYVGGNVLMEMALAFHLHKPIYLYESPDPTSPLYEEILGLEPIIINQELSKIKEEK